MSNRLMIATCALLSVALILVCDSVLAQASTSGSGEPNIPGEHNGSGEPNAVRNHRMPVVKYAVASPRACLIGLPDWSTAAYYLPTGDADNFARADGSLRVPVGTRVVVCLSRDLEGVWYSGSYGCLGTSLVVQYCKVCACEDLDSTDCPDVSPDPNRCHYARCACEQCMRLGAVRCPLPDDPAIEPCPWITIGTDGARGYRRGPSIGRAKVGVPVYFNRPGVYLLRAIVHTYAEPGYPQPLEDWNARLLAAGDPRAVLPIVPIAEDKDTIYIKVHVTETAPGVIEPDEMVSDDPDLVHIKPIPKDIDPDEPVDLDSDLNGDEVIDMADFAIMAQQWGKEHEMPFTDDE